MGVPVVGRRHQREALTGKLQIGDVETYPNESAAHAAAGALRLTINNGSKHKNLQRTTISILVFVYRV